MPSVSSKRRLYLRGLRKDVTDDELSKYLSCYGKVIEVKLLSNYAFVQFESEQDAATVLETYRTQPLLGNPIVIEFAHPLRKDMPSISSSHSSEKSRNSNSRFVYTRYPVIVQGLPRDLRWQELKDFGRSSGMLVAYCDLDKTQKGRGFIEFFTREDAKFAVRILDGKHLAGKKVRVMDPESMRRSERSLRQGRNRSRESSPRRSLRYDRIWEDYYSSHLPEYSSYPRSYDGYSGDWTYLNGQGYDYSEKRRLASPYEFNERDQGYPCRGFGDNDANLERIDRTSNRAVIPHCYHERDEHDYNQQHYLSRDTSFFDHRDPGYEQEMYQSGRVMDPYQ